MIGKIRPERKSIFVQIYTFTAPSVRRSDINKAAIFTECCGLFCHIPSIYMFNNIFGTIWHNKEFCGINCKSSSIEISKIKTYLCHDVSMSYMKPMPAMWRMGGTRQIYLRTLFIVREILCLA